jgi:hypothetical protein
VLRAIFYPDLSFRESGTPTLDKTLIKRSISKSWTHSSFHQYFILKGYSLVSPTSLPFSLRYDLTRGDLSLVVEKNLDRELISSYKFDVIAYDGGNQTGILHVYITINDVNDSPPKFDQLIYTIKNISENIPIGSILLRVHATDADEGINGEITYHLINQENCFEIDQTTGDIRVICLLDYETKTNHQLEIEARDGGEGSKTDFCT